MNKKFRLVLIILAAVLVLIVAAVIYADARRQAAVETPVPTESAALETTPTATPAPEETESAVVAVGGDVVMHTGLNDEAKTDNGYDYTPIFGTIGQYFSDADYAVCSLVTTFSAGTDYTAFPRFKSPDALAASLASVGFDLVNTGTSHAMDSFKDGVDYTLDTLDAAGLAHVGTYRTQEERDAQSGVTYAEVNGIKLAFLSYTCDTNRIPVSGFSYAVNVCTSDYLTTAADMDYDQMAEDLAAAKEGGADAVIVFMSWGTEFDTAPSQLQSDTADYLFAHGADIVIGGHCRVPQPMETREVTDEDGSTRTCYLAYSLGNLLSCQNDANTNVSAVVNIRLEKGVESGETHIASVSYVPFYMCDLYDYGIDDFGWHYRLVDLNAAISAYDAGTPWDFMTEDIYNDMVRALADLHGFFGETLDAGAAAQAG